LFLSISSELSHRYSVNSHKIMNNKELTEKAIQEKYLIELSQGIYVFTPKMVSLINELRKVLIDGIALEGGFEEWIFPRIIPEHKIKDTGWLKHHPNQAFLVHSLPNSNALVGRFLLDPIQCVSLYSILSDKNIEAVIPNTKLPFKVFEVNGGWTYRNESDLEGLFKSKAFLRIEFIYFATSNEVFEIRNTILEKSITLLNDKFNLNLTKAKGDSCFLESPPIEDSGGKYLKIGVDVSPQTATIDIVYQRNETKEFLELASGTAAGNHIPTRFNITSSQTTDLCSGCFGLGLNRIALAILESSNFELKAP
jgi:seryl-tRNA synthetase